MEHNTGHINVTIDLVIFGFYNSLLVNIVFISLHTAKMRFQIISLLALLGPTAAAAKRWVGMENLPDGPYKGVTHADGSTTVTSMETGETHTFALLKIQKNLKKDLTLLLKSARSPAGVMSSTMLVAMRLWWS